MLAAHGVFANPRRNSTHRMMLRLTPLVPGYSPSWGTPRDALAFRRMATHQARLCALRPTSRRCSELTGMPPARDRITSCLFPCRGKLVVVAGTDPGIRLYVARCYFRTEKSLGLSPSPRLLRISLRIHHNRNYTRLFSFCN
jgi:hypothetical protein